jgi:hypothetical protein
VLLRRFSDLDQRDCVSLNPSTDLEPRREAIVLSQVGAPTISVSKKSVFSALNRAGTPEEGSSSES